MRNILSLLYERSIVLILYRNVIPFPNAAYGPTKIVQHWYARTVANQQPWLTSFPIDPG